MASGDRNGYRDLNFLDLIQNFRCHALMIIIAVKKRRETGRLGVSVG